MRGIRWGIVLVAALVTSGCGYNQIQTKDETVNKAKGDIEAQLQRRNIVGPPPAAGPRCPWDPP